MNLLGAGMKRGATRIALAVLLLTAACTIEEGSVAPNVVTYEVTPLVSDGTPRLQVDLTFRGDTDGVTHLFLPDAWASEAKLHRAVSRLELIEGGLLQAGSNPARRIVRHLPGTRVHIRYELTQDFEGEPALGAGYKPGYRPIVRSSWVHFIGHVGLVLPQFSGSGPDTQREVAFRWRNLPENWQAATSFGDGPEGWRQRLSERDLRAAVYVAGDFRILERERDGASVRIAVRGEDWTFSTDEFAGRVMDVFATSREFWGDPEVSAYLVTMIPVDLPKDAEPGFLSISGTGLTRSFAIFSTVNADPARMNYVLTHEMQHEWITRRMGILAPPEGRLYWFSEGFTDFYTYRLMVMAGLLTAPEYVSAINDAIEDYYESAAASMTLEEVAAGFWSDSAINRMPYLRGHLLALSWDAQIRERTKGASGLDTAVRSLLEKRRQALFLPRLTATYLLTSLDEIADGRAARDHARHLVAGEKLTLSPGLLGPCAVFAGATVLDDGTPVPRFAVPEPYTPEREQECRDWLAGPPPPPPNGNAAASSVP
jgi:predicted metalloprotease with PDZ domain